MMPLEMEALYFTSYITWSIKMIRIGGTEISIIMQKSQVIIYF